MSYNDFKTRPISLVYSDIENELFCQHFIWTLNFVGICLRKKFWILEIRIFTSAGSRSRPNDVIEYSTELSESAVRYVMHYQRCQEGVVAE